MPCGASFAVDLAITFVGENDEAEAARQPGELFQISEIGDRALRIRRRGEIDGDGARQQVVGERVEIGQEAGGLGRRQIDRLAIRRDRAGGIGRVERIGNQHRGLAGARRHIVLRRQRGEKQSFARAVEHQHFVHGIDRALEREARVEPKRDRFAERIEALVHRIAAEFVDMRGDHRPDKSGNGVLRLAHRKADRGLARRRVAQQFPQTHERRARIGRAKRRGISLAYSSCTSQTAGPRRFKHGIA